MSMSHRARKLNNFFCAIKYLREKEDYLVVPIVLHHQSKWLIKGDFPIVNLFFSTINCLVSETDKHKLKEVLNFVAFLSPITDCKNYW